MIRKLRGGSHAGTSEQKNGALVGAEYKIPFPGGTVKARQMLQKKKKKKKSCKPRREMLK